LPARRNRPWLRRVIVDAFGGNAEAELVDDLRSRRDLAISIVAEEAGEICGHVALSGLIFPVGALALAPVSVLKAKQLQGIGSALVRRAVQRACKAVTKSFSWVGEPYYYTRFAFTAEKAAPFPSKYAGRHFIALNLTERWIEEAPVIYADAFDKVE
jgi:putative acetyltransferase